MRIMQCQNHEDVSIAPGGREQVVRLQCMPARLKSLSHRSGDRSASGNAILLFAVYIVLRMLAYNSFEKTKLEKYGKCNLDIYYQ